jgi:putative membrane protein
LSESERQELDNATRLAFDRTQLAEERTTLAWIRTATSLITFGFAIYSFFGIPSGAGHEHATHEGPRVFSLLLIVMGLVTLFCAAVQRRRSIKAMRAIHPEVKTGSMAATIGVLIACLGVLGLAILLLRV